MLYELSARYDSRKSFYQKAMVSKTSRDVTLLSYGLDVMRYDLDAHEFTRRPGQPESQTTSRHMVEFMRQYGDDSTLTSKDVRAIPTW